MQVNEENLKKVLIAIFEALKQADIELTAYRIVVLGLKPMISDLDESLAVAKSAAAKMLQDKYAPLEKFPELFDEAVLNQKLAEILAQWKPKGPSN